VLGVLRGLKPFELPVPVLIHVQFILNINFASLYQISLYLHDAGGGGVVADGGIEQESKALRQGRGGPTEGERGGGAVTPPT
jgi:hypothetical protein